MKVSVNWLKDYVDLSGISTDQLVDILTNAGLEVDEVIDQKAKFENFVVGFVKEKKKHPNADKLSLCVVDDGNKTYNVICGAPNVDANQKIVFAKVGAVIPEGGFEIKKAKIRGESSEGMICSEKELGISDNHDGIMVLPENAETGQPLADYFGFTDAVLDIDITPNRADAFSHIGVARDLAAIMKRPLKLPEIRLIESDHKSSDYAAVEIENSVDCPRYVARVVRNVNVQESPKWLQDKLISIGLRPINNIVDVTNFVLHEVGQPLHAFDLDKLAGNKIVVKSAKEGDKFTTLDSKERNLRATDLMICDGEKQVAIAGVMGGENSEVSESTKNVLIESAYFRPSAVRKTSKLLGLSTDASTRFERGTNPDVTIFAAQRAAQLMAETGGGEIASGEIDAYPNVIEEMQVSVRYDRINKIVGIDIPKEEVDEILQILEFNIMESNNEKATVTIPSFRHDIEREIDLVEEVIRIYGYDKIPDIDKIKITLDHKVDQSKFKNDVRDSLVALGMNEIVSNSLLSEEIALKFGKAIPVMNPQSKEMSHLRPSMLPGMLITISKNLKVRERNLRFFEIGKVFELKETKKIKSFDDFEEKQHLIIALTGNAIDTQWYQEDREYDFYDLKGIVENLFEMIDRNSSFKFNINEEDDFFYSSSFSIESDNGKIGIGGTVKKEYIDIFDIDQPVFVFDLDMEQLEQLPQVGKRFQPLLKYPKVIRDCAFILDKNIKQDKVVAIIEKASSKLLKNVKLFDIFESDSLGKDKKSLAFQMEFYDESRTLKEEEVDKEFWKAIDEVKNKFNAQLRG